MSNPYKILGVSIYATQKQIKNAYRKLVIKYHPDVSLDADSEKKFKEIIWAYNSIYNHAIRDHKFINNEIDINNLSKNKLHINEIENIFKNFDTDFWKRLKKIKKAYSKIFLSLHIINKFLRVFLFLSLTSLVIAFFWKDILPKINNIDESLKKDPIIIKEVTSNFQFEFNEINYIGVPISKIEINALLINQNTPIKISSANIYKKNLWLIFGNAFLNNDYKKSEVDSSNVIRMELFTNDKIIQEKLENIYKNDQVYLSGFLFDYYPKGQPQWKVFTSRNLGSARYQMIYLDDFSVIKRSSLIPLLIIDINKYLFPSLLILTILIWFIIGYIEIIYFKKIFKEK